MKYKKKNAKTYSEHKGYYISSLIHDFKKPLNNAVSITRFEYQGHSPMKWAAAVEDEVDFLKGIVSPFPRAPEDDE